MQFMPFQVLSLWLRGLLGLVVFALGIGLLWEWSQQRSWVEVVPAAEPADQTRADGAAVTEGQVERRVHHWRFGLNWPTAYLLGGLTLMAMSLGGGAVVFPLLRPVGADEPTDDRTGHVRRLKRPDGSELQ